MRVHHRAGARGTDDFEMKKGFSGRFTFGSSQHYAAGINFKDLASPHASFVDRACSYCHAQGITGNHSAEISAGAQHPAAAMEVGSEADEFFGGIRESHRKPDYTIG